MRSPAARGAALLAIAVAAVVVWRGRSSNDEREIRSRIDALRTEINGTASGGLQSASRAAQIGSYFTEDAVVDLGKGASPITGRSTLVGMALRLQPRTSAFRLDVDDVGVEMTPGASEADVTLTASFMLRSSTGEESRDAREFVLSLTRASGTWLIARVTAIDTLR
jgi:hypothetical protein